MPCRSPVQVEHMFRLNLLNRRRYIDRVCGEHLPGKKSTLDEYLASLTTEIMRRWWVEHSLHLGHPAATDDSGLRYLRFIDCRATAATEVKHRLKNLGYDSGTIPISKPEGWVSVYIHLEV